MTTDWSKTWAGQNGWYDGYDSTATGSFVDISTLSGAERDAAITSVRENIIGLLEQKGVTRAQILDPTSDVGQFYQTQMANAASGSDNATRDAYQAAAQTTTSGTDRGNKWGADTDHTMGRTYLDAIAAGGSATVTDLYTSGFGRTEEEMAKDTEGLQYWEDKLASGAMTIQQIAQSFAQSEEANIRDVYSDEYGRDADQGGLDYFMNVSGREDATQTDHNAYDASQLVSDSLKARGNDYEQVETSIRDAGWDLLGQASNEAQRSTMPTLGDNRLFTAMENTQVVDWVKKIQSGEMTLEEVIARPELNEEGTEIAKPAGILYDRGDRMDAFNQYDVDDFGDQATGMGRFASLDEIQKTIDDGETPDDIRELLSKKKWDSLTQEEVKEVGEDGLSTSATLAQQAAENFESTPFKELRQEEARADLSPNETWASRIQAYYQKQIDDKKAVKSAWRPTVPDKPGIPDKMPVAESEIDYMPNTQADPFSKTPYGDAKQAFDTEKSKTQTPTQLASPTVAQRFTGTSAKGVKMKRSKASMGTTRGTKQLGREQQTKSLNI